MRAKSRQHWTDEAAKIHTTPPEARVGPGILAAPPAGAIHDNLTNFG